MALFLYNLLLPLLLVVYLPVFVYKQLKRGNVLKDFGERFGVFSNVQHATLKRLHSPVWVHAVSVGETVAALGFIRRWQQRSPELDFVLSVTTTTGHAMAEKRLPEGVRLIYCPVDFPLAVRRSLRLVRPRMLVIFEVEIWPNLVAAAAGMGAEVVLVNGRMSDRSARGYRRWRWFFGPTFRKFSLFCMQSDEDVKRIRAVVGDSVPVISCNTMKFDQVPDLDTKAKGELLDAAFGSGPRRVWVAGSTHAGEEALIAEVFAELKKSAPDLKLVLVPRHQERTSEVEAVLKQHGLNYCLRKPQTGSPIADGQADVLLVNSTGELMSFFSAADIAFVGKSLAGQAGGHNIIEPAIFGKAIVHGSAMGNFRLVVDIFREAGAAVEVGADAALLPTMLRLLDNPAECAELGRRARQVVEKCRGAMDRTIDAL